LLLVRAAQLLRHSFTFRASFPARIKLGGFPSAGAGFDRRRRAFDAARSAFQRVGLS
jgi:hypothetical protein